MTGLVLNLLLRQVIVVLSLQIVFARSGNDVTPASTGGVNDTIRLLHDMIDPYDNRIRPLRNQSQPIRVYFTFHLLSLVEMDELQQRIQLSFWANFSWWDEIRTWNPDNYGGNDVLYPNLNDIWRPRTQLVNAVAKREIFADDGIPFSMLSNGLTRWYCADLFYFQCGMDLTYFPFDSQTCAVKLMSTQLGSQVNLIPAIPVIPSNDYVINSEWELKSTQVVQFLVTIQNDSFSFVRLIITFTRRPMYYLMNVLVPIMLLSFLSLFGFIVPKESGERASFSVTVLLSLAVFMGVVSDQLPPSSDTIPYISVYLFSLLCLSTFSVLIIVCQLRCTTTEWSNEREKELDRNGESPPRPERFSRKDYHVGKETDEQCTHSLERNSGLIRNSSKSILERNGDGTTEISHMESTVSIGSSKMCSAARNGSFNPCGSLGKLRSCFNLYHHDLVLFFSFTSAWLAFTAVFVYLIITQPES